MRIDAYNQVSKIYNTSAKLKTQSVSKAGLRDKVEISEFGKIYQTTKSIVGEIPDIREDKVAKIKSKIDEGTYEVSNESFAEKLLADYNEVL